MGAEDRTGPYGYGSVGMGRFASAQVAGNDPRELGLKAPTRVSALSRAVIRITDR